MAAKKGKAETATKPEPAQRSVINLKGDDAERDWLSLASGTTHIPKATIVRLALRDWAKARGLPTYPHFYGEGGAEDLALTPVPPPKAPAKPEPKRRGSPRG